jgi:hypothetical protein
MEYNQDPVDPDSLISLVQRADASYKQLEIVVRPGRKSTYSQHSFLLMAVVVVTTHTFRDSELRRLLEVDRRLREALGFESIPHRTTIGRRLAKLIPEAEAQISHLGGQIIDEVKPDASQSEVSALDGRMYEAAGPQWHAKNRCEGRIPQGLRNVDTDSAWSKSGYRGWVQGYRLMLQTLVFPDAVPICALWSSNAAGEATLAEQALEDGLLQVTDVMLGDTSFGGEDLTTAYASAGGWLLTPKQLPTERRSWKDDLYEYRKETIELLFARIIETSGLRKCPVRGIGRNGAFILASVWIYQICFLDNYRSGKPVAQIKAILETARWRAVA